MCPPPAPKTVHTRRAVRGGGRSIFWKTRDIGLASCSIISLRFWCSDWRRDTRRRADWQQADQPAAPGRSTRGCAHSLTALAQLEKGKKKGFQAVLRIRDPGWLTNQDPYPGWTTRIIFRELRNKFLGLKYLNSVMRIWDGKNSDPGSRMEKIRIRDKHPGSATLFLGTRRRYRYIVKRLLCAIEVQTGPTVWPFRNYGWTFVIGTEKWRALSYSAGMSSFAGS